MRHLIKLALMGMVGLSTSSVYGGLYTYEWTGGAPGYSGTIVLDAPSSPADGGSLSDIVSWVETTPATGTITVDLNITDPAYSPYLDDPTFTWNSAQITEMGMDAFDSSETYDVLAAQNYAGLGLNQLSIENLNQTPPYTQIDVTGSWEAAPVPEPTTIVAGVLILLPFGASTLRVLRRNRAA